MQITTERPRPVVLVVRDGWEVEFSELRANPGLAAGSSPQPTASGKSAATERTRLRLFSLASKPTRSASARARFSVPFCRTCCCPVAPDRAIYFPGAFDDYGRRVLQEFYIPFTEGYFENSLEVFQYQLATLRAATSEPFDLLGASVVPIRLVHGPYDCLGFRFGQILGG